MKKNIIIKGKKVHDVGYRLFLMDAAEDFGIENFDVKNLKENDKEIVSAKIESSDENVNDFINFAKTNFPRHADVDGQSIEVNDYEGKIKSFEAFERSFMRHQTAKIANAGIGMLYKQDISIQKQDVMIQKQDVMIQKQDVMIQKQDQMLEKQDVMIQKQDQMLEKQDTTISILRDVKKDTEGIKEGIECIKKNTKSIEEKQDTTIGILRDIKQDTKYIPSVISEINDLKVKYGLMETNINRIKEVLNVPVSV